MQRRADFLAYQMKLRFLFASFVVLGLLSVDGEDLRAQRPEKAPEQSAARSGSQYRGGLVTPPLPKPRFTLTDTSGAPFDFWAKFARWPVTIDVGRKEVALAIKQRQTIKAQCVS